MKLTNDIFAGVHNGREIEISSSASSRGYRDATFLIDNSYSRFYNGAMMVLDIVIFACRAQ